jgi:hypothetical protein
MSEQTERDEVLSQHERADLFNAACRAHGGPPTFICRPCADAQDAVIERIIRTREAAAEARGAKAVLDAVEGAYLADLNKSSMWHAARDAAAWKTEEVER